MPNMLERISGKFSGNVSVVAHCQPFRNTFIALPMACGLPIRFPKHPAFGCPTVFKSWVHIVWRRTRSKTDRKKRSAHRRRQSHGGDLSKTETTDSTDMIADTEIDGADEDLFKQLSPDDAYLSCKYWSSLPDVLTDMTNADHDVRCQFI